MSIFILVPVVAPLIGQGILFLFYWKYIIAFFILFSLMTTSLLIMNIEETLKEPQTINFVNILKHFKEVLRLKLYDLYSLLRSSFRSLLTFINICQPLYLNYFDIGSTFPLFFALIASMLGLSSYFNSKYVWQFGAGKIALSFFLFLLMIWTLIALAFQVNYFSLNLVWFSIFIMISFSFSALFSGI